MSDSQPVAPDSVHVWRGFMAEGKTWKEFAQYLGEVFLPTGSLLQPGAGLHAFVPSMPDPKDKPKGVPDQTALMFWTTPQAYKDGFKTVAVRAYTNLHGGAYGPPSAAEFPIKLEGELKAGQPYYLIDKPADWMLGRIQHLIAAPINSDTFFDDVLSWAECIQKNPEGVEGCLLCIDDDYLVVWLLSDPECPINKETMERLAAKLNPVLNTVSDQYKLPAGLWDEWPGINLTQGESSLNIQLQRPLK